MGLLFLALHIPCVAAHEFHEPSFPLRVSSNHRYLEEADGTPVLYQADTAWMLFLNLTEAESQEYFERRQAQGFNVIQLQLTGFIGMQNRAGALPFDAEHDFRKPNEAYFAHIDRVIARARRLNLLLAVAPLWSGCCGEGWLGQDEQGHPKPLTRLTPAAAYQFGCYLGTRYGTADNVLWILGGDNDPGAGQEAIRQLALGLKSEAPRQLITFHAASTHSSTDVWPAEESWLDISMTYTYFRGFDKAWNKVQPNVYEVSHAEYRKTPLRPFILGESTYEGEHGEWGSETQVRKQAYWAMLSGACGQAYGSPAWKCDENWREQLSLPGGSSLRHLRTLLERHRWWEFAPDFDNKLLSAGRGELGDNGYVAAALAADRTKAILYFPEQRTVNLDLTLFRADRVQFTWWNPAEGAPLQTVTQTGGQHASATPPSEGDSVLILECISNPGTK